VLLAANTLALAQSAPTLNHVPISTSRHHRKKVWSVVDEHEDPGTGMRINAAVQLAIRLRTERRSARLDELVMEAVDTVFRGCGTDPTGIDMRSPALLHQNLMIEVLQRVRQEIAMGSAASCQSDPIDVASADSFPASDPPAWIWR
jgi:hypothetical protein